MRILVILLFTLNITACESVIEKQLESKVVHIVLIWLKEQGNEQHIQQIIDATQQLKEIAKIKELRVGESIVSDRKIVDASFDVGLYMIFDSNDAMQDYLVHPKHEHAVRTIIKPLASKIRVHDFISM